VIRHSFVIPAVTLVYHNVLVPYKELYKQLCKTRYIEYSTALLRALHRYIYKLRNKVDSM